MGCGTSKAAAPVTPSQLPAASSTQKQEFTPENKPTPQQPKPQDEVSKLGDNDSLAPKRAQGPLQVAPVPSLPPPPSTPPPGTVQSLDGTGPLSLEPNGFSSKPSMGEDTDGYFPQQVSLNFNGAAANGGGSHATSASAPLPSVQPQPPLPTLQPVASNRHGSVSAGVSSSGGAPAPVQAPAQAPAPAPTLTASSSGSGAANGAAAAGPSAPDPNDPWSHLQSTYRIGEHDRDPNRASASNSRDGMGSSRSRRGLGAVDPGPKEMLVLGDDDEFSRGGMPAPGAAGGRLPTMSRPPLPPPKPTGQPKQGGWGGGELAVAGTLMVGDDDWLEGGRQSGSGMGYGVAGQQPMYGRNDTGDRDPGPASRAPQQVPSKGRGGQADDVMCEDIEDVDSLLQDEMLRHGLSNKSLADKLAAYEMQHGHED